MDELREWIRERWALLAAGILSLWFGIGWWQGRPVAHPPGILAPADPLQTEPESAAGWTFRKHRITPLARFELRGRVLAVERYRFDRAAELSPVDFAMGWGPMSDTRVIEGLSISQGNRWYRWSTPRLPIPESEISTHSANMHMIPATAAMERRLLSVRPGQLVVLSGQLIRADGQDGWHWVSSLTRLDTGEGACEVIWVESIQSTDR